MTKTRKRGALTVLLCLLCALLCGCKQNPPEEKLYQKLLSAFEGAGYTCALEALPVDAPAPIYKASAWKALHLSDGDAKETVLVYFDESNRADYLATMIDADTYGYAAPFGQRFVLNYNGTNEKLKATLEGLNE